MFKRWLTLLALVVSFVGCGPYWTRPGVDTSSSDPPSNTYVCLDLPAEQLPGARDAVEEWDLSIHQWKHLVAVDGRQEPCAYWVHEVDHVDADDVEALAWASSIGGHEISMRKGWYEQDVTGILLHELGHAFGAQHVAGTLMNPTWFRHEFSCPDITTVVQVAAWNHINLGLLSWCYW